MSVSAGSEDTVLSMGDVAKIEKAFEGKGGAQMGFEVSVVEGAKHGFAVRGDPEKEEEARVSTTIFLWLQRVFCPFLLRFLWFVSKTDGGKLRDLTLFVYCCTILMLHFASVMCQRRVFADYEIL